MHKEIIEQRHIHTHTKIYKYTLIYKSNDKNFKSISC